MERSGKFKIVVFKKWYDEPIIPPIHTKSIPELISHLERLSRKPMRRPIPEWEIWTDGRELQEMAMALHGVANGSYEGFWPDEKLVGYHKALKWADAHWEEGLERYKPFDDGVRMMVRAAIQEWEHWTVEVASAMEKVKKKERKEFGG